MYIISNVIQERTITDDTEILDIEGLMCEVDVWYSSLTYIPPLFHRRGPIVNGIEGIYYIFWYAKKKYMIDEVVYAFTPVMLIASFSRKTVFSLAFTTLVYIKFFYNVHICVSFIMLDWEAPR